MSNTPLRTAQILELGQQMERMHMLETILPAFQKTGQAGMVMISTYSKIKEVAMTPKLDIEYRKKRLQQLAGDLGKHTTDWRNANAMVGFSVDETPLRVLMSEMMDGITEYLKDAKLSRLRSIFRSHPVDSDFIALVDQFTKRETQWNNARLWIATELYRLKKVERMRGSYKKLASTQLAPWLKNPDLQLMVNGKKLTPKDRRHALEIVESDTYGSKYFSDLVSRLSGGVE